MTFNVKCQTYIILPAICQIMLNTRLNSAIPASHKIFERVPNNTISPMCFSFLCGIYFKLKPFPSWENRPLGQPSGKYPASTRIVQVISTYLFFHMGEMVLRGPPFKILCGHSPRCSASETILTLAETDSVSVGTRQGAEKGDIRLFWRFGRGQGGDVTRPGPRAEKNSGSLQLTVCAWKLIFCA